MSESPEAKKSQNRMTWPKRWAWYKGPPQLSAPVTPITLTPPTHRANHSRRPSAFSDVAGKSVPKDSVGEPQGNEDTTKQHDGSMSTLSLPLVPLPSATEPDSPIGHESAPPTGLYVNELDYTVTESQLFEHFSAIGRAVVVRLGRDANTYRPLGYAHIEYSKAADAQMALELLNYSLIQNRACQIMWYIPGPRKARGRVNIIVKNLDEAIDTKYLYNVFVAAGDTLSCKVITDKHGRSRGYGFVCYRHAEDAESAIMSLNGMRLNNQKIYVDYISDQVHQSRPDEIDGQVKNLYVKNLNLEITQEELTQLFAQYGRVSSAFLVTDERGKSKASGFINFEEFGDAQRAVYYLHDLEWRETSELVLTSFMASAPESISTATSNFNNRDRTVKSTKPGIVQLFRKSSCASPPPSHPASTSQLKPYPLAFAPYQRTHPTGGSGASGSHAGLAYDSDSHKPHPTDEDLGYESMPDNDRQSFDRTSRSTSSLPAMPCGDYDLSDEGQEPFHRTYAAYDRSMNATSPESPSQPEAHAIRVMNLLDDTLRQEAKKKALKELTGADAQLLINYLDSISLDTAARQSPVHKERIKAFYRLSKSSQLYPQQYILRDIIKAPVPQGSGGLCDVFPGKYQDQDICLKVIRVYKNKDIDEAMRVLAKEAILWGQLCHPNIMPFYGLYYVELDLVHRACLVSPWMKNGNLVDYLHKHPDALREALVYDVTCGLDYLHQESIIHGDLKGVNILVSDTGVARITDFGLSSVTTNDVLMRTLATTTVNRVTFRWVSPEILDDSESRSCASDVWALGCVFYEIFTRCLPFYEHKSDATVLGKIIRGILPTRPKEGKDDTHDLIDDEAWGILKRCWAFEPEDRPTCQQLLADLKILRYDIRSRDREVGDINLSARFQLAMRMEGSVIPVDLHRVEEVLMKL